MVRVLTVVWLAFLLALPASRAVAVQPDEVLDNPVLEKRAREISLELRCLVCQNQSIDDSDAPLARDLRILVRERLTGGDTDEQVIDFIVERYGEFVLLRPRFAPHTLILWLAPPVLFLIGTFVLYRSYRRRRVRLAQPASKGLTAAEKRELNRLLKKS
jgi:cytochrome c-type biogenesis protein CcmH